ncbi:MAG: polysaccharide deacetylase family protein [Bacteroidota bacterium]
MRIIVALMLILLLQACNTINEKKEKSIDWAYWMGKANFEESKVADYTLPEFMAEDQGNKELYWIEKRRDEILNLYRNEIYGKVPEADVNVVFKVTKTVNDAVGGKATMKEITATFTNNGKSAEMNILIYTPNKVEGKVPMFLGLNFFGNHTVHNDENITQATGYVINKGTIGVKNHKATEAKRGVFSERWQVEKLIDSGYGLTTVFYGDLDPDFDDGYQNGVQPLFYKDGQTKPADNEWGSIAVWSWGLSRVMDYFETDSNIDKAKVAVVGHSRLAKVALWTVANDHRFAISISNNSGSAGAALFRRKFGETIDASLAYAPQWYAGNFKKYSTNEKTLPIDQHMLLSLIAPRPLYVASATKDNWADPKGEFLAAKYATEIYHLFGKQGIEVDSIPKPNVSIQTNIGYHIREGKHNITEFDWNNYISFAKKHFATKNRIALTFDDGPDNKWTPVILDILKEHNVKATFFLVGKNVKEYPEVVKRIYSEGHQIGNHSMNHLHLNRISTMDSLMVELESANKLIKNITGVDHYYFRPPYGHLSVEQREYLKTTNYEFVMWSIDPHDWDVKNVIADDIFNIIDGRAYDGANILLHSTNAGYNAPDYKKNKENTIGALPMVIESLQNRNFEFVRVDEL